MNNIKSISAHYQSSPSLEAPFAHEFRLDLQLQEKLHLSYELTYTKRQDISMDELLNAGFTGKDDIKIEGFLPKIWENDIFLLLKNTPFQEKANTDDENMSLNFLDKSKWLAPTQIAEWYYLFQELLQALYESQGIEQSLALSFVWTKTQANEYFFEASFAQRQGFLSLKNAKAIQKVNLTWEQVRNFLEIAYNEIEFYEDEGKENYPKHKGFFIAQDGFWYEAGKTVSGTGIKKIQSFLIQSGLPTY